MRDPAIFNSTYSALCRRSVTPKTKRRKMLERDWRTNRKGTFEANVHQSHSEHNEVGRIVKSKMIKDAS
jgi:hypothetical protein